MKSFLLLYAIAFFATHVAASAAAGPFQAIFLYYAYRMDLAANGIGNTAIAAGCRSEIVPGPGPCTFDEFTDYIQRAPNPRNQNPPPPPKTNVGTNTMPDVMTTYNDLRNPTLNPPNGFMQDVDNTKLFDNKKVLATPPAHIFSDVYKAVIENIQACRRAVAARDGSEAAIQSELDNAKRAMDGIHNARIAEQATGLLDEVNGWLAAAHLQPAATTQRTYPGVGTWEEFDSAATLQNNPGLKQRKADKIRNFAAKYTSKGGEGHGHEVAIITCQKGGSRLHGPNTC